MAKTCTTTKLTKSTVDRATPQPGGKQYLYFDTELRGFGLCVGKRTKTYFVRTKHGRIVIGHHGVFSPDQARARAQQMLAKVADGENPKSAGRGVTLRAAVDLKVAALRNSAKSETTITGYKYVIKKYLSPWLDRPLAAITREDANARHAAIAAEVAAGKYAPNRPRGAGDGQYAANAAMVALRTVYANAMRTHDLPPNPTIGVYFFNAKREKTELPLAELHRWHAHVLKIANPIRRDFLLFVLHTGQRRASAAATRWEHVDFAARVLHIPHPKGGRAFALPLTTYLVRLLKARQKENTEVFEDSPWVFPATSASGHIADPHEVFAGMQWTVHDLRRWFTTTAKAANLHPWDIALLLNHRSPSGVTAGYFNPDPEALRPAMDKVGAKLLALCAPPAAQVTPQRKRAGKGAGR